jgi:hypothetical protein
MDRAIKNQIPTLVQLYFCFMEAKNNEKAACQPIGSKDYINFCAL